MLASGTRLGSYEILSAIGAGGMGEVYKARDTRLDRIVAIKILSSEIASVPDLRERFEREARTVASLNHPHICTLHDVGRQDPSTGSGQAVDYLVMEFLDGETLEQRLKKGALQVDQALQIGTQIADALAAAHRAGITHRDLKPGNIMLTRSGAKLLDFGLAKTGTPTAAGNLSMLPTTPPGLTQEGTILGTFQYMAPEQLEGQDADARTDIFAFGAVLYEMLTGKRAFEGKSHASLIGAILKDEPPPVSRVQPVVPRSLDRVLGACLAKNPEDRWQSARDLLRELQWVVEGVLDTAPVRLPRRRPHVVRAVAAALGLVAFAAAVAIGWAWRTPPPQPVVRFDVLPPPGGMFPGANGVPRFALSPDGESLAYEAGPPGGPFQLWVRRLDAVAPRPLPLTANALDGAVQGLFWLADGRYIGFFDDVARKLKKVDLQSGAVQALADASGNQMAGSANATGVILFSTGATKGVQRVPASGGVPVQVTTLDPAQEELAHLWPRFLPDGRHFLYLSQSRQRERWAVYVASLDSPDRKMLLQTEYMAEFAPPNHLLYVRGDALFAQTLDLATLELIGEPALIAQPIMGSFGGRAGISVSDTGVLVHVGGSAGIAGRARTLVWMDRQGREEPLQVPPRAYFSPHISPDGTRVALDIRDQENDIWVWDLARATLTRLTFDPRIDGFPVWTPDSKRIAFASTRIGVANIFWQAADGTGTADRLTEAPTNQLPSSIAPDGSALVFDAATDVDLDLHAVTLNQNPGVRVLFQAPSVQRNGRVSPDGRWIAYESQESAQNQIYVRPYPDVSAGRWQVSTAGGVRPVWARNSRELFYVAPGDRLMSVRIEAGGAWVASAPAEIFISPGLAVAGTTAPTYDVSLDGQRFLVVKPVAGNEPTSAPTSLIVVQNWLEQLERSVPTN